MAAIQHGDTSTCFTATMEIQIFDSPRSLQADASPSQVVSQTEPSRLIASWARHEDEVRQAQKLRYQVFAQEMGASLAPPSEGLEGLDIDRFDAFCEHLIIRTVETQIQPSQVVGTYRVLTPAAAMQAGALYSDGEFDLHALDPYRSEIAELGRSCIDAQWRTGGVILMLWSQLVQFMERNQLKKMVGCASIGMRDGGHVAASLWQQLRRTHLSAEELRVTPRVCLPVAELRSDLNVEPPPLIKGYLKCGAVVLGAPAWDPDFGTADLPMMLDLQDLTPAYRRRFGLQTSG